MTVATGLHDRLVEMVGSLSPDEVAGPSYASEWSVAQVLSHLGSGAEIFTLIVEAGQQGEPAPGPDAFGPVWACWDAKPPEEKARDALVADRKFLDGLEALSPGDRDQWHLTLFGADQTLADLLRMRVGEHAVHSWDIAVIRDPTARLAPEAVALLVDGLDQLVARTTQVPEPLHLRVVTHDPERRFLLTAGDGSAELRPLDEVTDEVSDGASGGDQGALDLPAESFIRLVYGRLDPGHTPAVGGDPADLDRLRLLFPGF
jgi:uncharacterized protein (TIGR03083 family)